MRQQWDRYDQGRALEFERVRKAVRDAEEKVRGLEKDYSDYKNSEPAAEARLRDGQQTDGQSPGGGRPSDAPMSSTLRQDPTGNQSHLLISAEFTKFRKLRELHPDMSIPGRRIHAFSDLCRRTAGGSKKEGGNNRTRTALSGRR